MNLNLNDKNALVCGSTQGIGKAAAIGLASEGVKVTLVARDEAKLKAVIAALPNAQLHDYIVADFMDPKGLKSKVEAYIKNNQGFHILINNTGGPRSGAIIEASLEEFENAFTQHLKCNHVLTQLVVPYMKAVSMDVLSMLFPLQSKNPLKA